VIDRWIVDNAPSRRYPIYTRGNIGEVYPEPVTPLTWTLGAIPASEQGWRDALARFGAFDLDEFSGEQIEVLGCFGGYGYLNVSISRIFGVRVPGLTPEQIDHSFWGEMPGVPPYRALDTDEDPEKSDRIQKVLRWILGSISLPDLERDRKEVADLRAGRPDYATLDAAALIERSRSLVPEVRRLFAEHLFITYCATVPVGMIQDACQQLGDPTLAMRLVTGIGGVDSAAPSMAMWALGRQAAASAELSAVFDAGLDGLLDRLAESADRDIESDAAFFVKELRQLLFEFGSRGPNEWETSSPTWETKPELALAAIDRMRVSPADHDPTAQQLRSAQERLTLVPEVLDRLSDDLEAQGQLAAALSAAGLFLAGRERSKTNIVRLVHEMRMSQRALGSRLVAQGVLDEPEDVSMLMENELDAFVADPASFRETIRARKHDYLELFDLEPPFVVDGEVPPLSQWARRNRTVEHVRSGAVLEGIPGCPGKATGRARVILDPADAEDLEPGDVLVAPITDPAWTPLFVPSAAVVVDVGAQISHAVIVSRELGIPCVVSVTDATRRIPDGATVTVDGTTGTVTLV